MTYIQISETVHQNIYTGNDRTSGWLKWVAEAHAHELPEPRISPLCVLFGHRWNTPVSLMPGANGRACKRCARRGLFVIETRQEDASNQDS